MQEQSLLVTTLVEIADALGDEFDVIDALTLLVNRCVELVDVDVAGIMLAAPGGELQLLALSNESLGMFDLFQIQMREGPSVLQAVSTCSISSSTEPTVVGTP